jgi:hypothetical protein
MGRKGIAAMESYWGLGEILGLIGLGLAIIAAFLWREISALPPYVKWPGVAFGVGLILSAFLPAPPLHTVYAFTIFAVAWGVGWAAKNDLNDPLARFRPQPPQLQPRAESPPPSRERVIMREALGFIDNGEWNKRPRRATSARKMREAAIHGDISIWGSSGINIQPLPIKAAYWEHWQIDWPSMLRGEAETAPLDSEATGVKFYSLTVGKAEVERIWPPRVGVSLTLRDYDELDQKKQFTLVELASYWVNEKLGDELSNVAKEAYEKLGESAHKHELEVIRPNLREVINDAYEQSFHGTVARPNPNWIVTKESAINYAFSVGDKPPFLFPKERVKP